MLEQAEKSAQAGAVALAGWVLAWFHFAPNAVQDERALLGLRLLCSGCPARLRSGRAAAARFPRSSLTCVSASQAAAFSAAKVTKAAV